MIRKEKAKKHIIVLISLWYIVFSFFFVRLIYIYTSDSYYGGGGTVYGEEVHQRGNIYFTNKDGVPVVAAHSSIKQRIIANPKKINEENIGTIYTILNTIIPLDFDTFNKKVFDKKKGYAVIEKEVSKKEAEQIQTIIAQYGLYNAIYIEEYMERVYPHGEVGARLIGFVGYDTLEKQEKKGVYGLEKFYNEVLDSKKKIFNETKILQENDVETTIDINVQHMLFDTLKTINENNNSEYSFGIVVRPHSGEIVALETFPSFDVNQKETLSSKDARVFQNPIVQNYYEFGSIFKPLTIAIGLESEGIDFSFSYNDKGFLKVNKKTIRNHNKKAYGNDIGLQTIIDHSLNLGVAAIVQRIGIDEFSNYMKRFDFEYLTNIDLPAEQSGRTNLDSEIEIDHITTSYGQGIAVSPIAMVRALSTLANGGKLLKFSVSKTPEPEISNFIFSKSVTEDVTKLLTDAYEKTLLSGTLESDRYSIAGKTGTSFFAVDLETGEYDKENTLHSFFGYFPASDPQYLILLATIAPQVEGTASTTLPRPFSNLAHEIIDYYNIPPDK